MVKYCTLTTRSYKVIIYLKNYETYTIHFAAQLCEALLLLWRQRFDLKRGSPVMLIHIHIH